MKTLIFLLAVLFLLVPMASHAQTHTFCPTDATCTWTGPQTFNGPVSIPGNVSVGGTLGAQSVNGVVNAGSYATFALALAACPNPGTLSISSAVTVSANAATPSTCTLQFVKGGSLSIANGATATINSAVVAPEDAQIFSLIGTGAVAGLTFTRPEWFGGTTSAAVLAAYNSLASTGGKIQFRSATYVSPWISHATEIIKTRVELAGAGQPEYNSQTAPTALTGAGTIIQGPVWVMADQNGTPANGFYIHELGVDSGSAVCTALFSGTGQQGVFVNNNFAGGTTDGPPFIEGVRVENVTTLLQSASAAFHSILVDNGDGTIIQNVRTFFGIYGVVTKGKRTNIDGVYSRGHSTVSVYVKSDTNFGIAQDTTVNNVRITFAAAAYDTAGLFVESQAVQAASAVMISNYIARGTSFCAEFIGTSVAVSEVNFSNFTCNNTNQNAVFVGGTVNSTRVSISNGSILNTTAGDAIVIQSTATDTTINNVQINSVTAGNGITNSGTRTKINNVSVVSTGAFGVTAGAGSMCIEGLTGSANTAGLLNPVFLSSCTDGPKAMAGLMTTYNNIATTGNGLASEVATVDLTAQTAAQGTTTLYAVPATGAGQYRISWNSKITTAATGAATSTLGPLTVIWTDPDGVTITSVVIASINGGTVQTTGPTNNNTSTLLIGMPIMLNCKASTNIQFSFAYASNTANTMAYNLHIKLEAL